MTLLSIATTGEHCPSLVTLLQKGASPHDNFIVLHGLMRCLETGAC